MKKKILLIAFSLFTAFSVKAQLGFKLKPGASSITENVTQKIKIDQIKDLKNNVELSDEAFLYQIKQQDPNKFIITLKDINSDSTKKEDVYETLDIIQYNYKTTIKKQKNEARNNILHDLYTNSRQSNKKLLFPDSLIKRKSDSVILLGKQIVKLQVTTDSLYYLYVKDLMSFKSTNFGFGSLRSRAFFDLIYGNDGKRFNALGNAGVNFGNNTGSVYSEIVNGNLGLFRVSLGTMISNTGKETDADAKKEEAYQRLVTSGGNTVLNFEYPLAYLHSKNNQYNLISRLITRGTADFPEFGTKTEKWAGSGSFGLDLYADATTSNNNLRFFCNFNASKIYGTDVFKDNLGINKSNFTFGQLSLGLVFLQNFKISFIVATFSSEKGLQNRHIIAGGQVLR
ncbi:hypothetical protein HDE68_000759 [Pedobacter cryoconitis]|uniref:Uncharacterized protein n=1 Tax=Pedobacter cryoconitis TaxID=188932 RepID=A0A7W8ZIW4_9SPHI|nr:hypothetical protein [Pedobacter cryoconitis]MBB5634874.1 hypothetical protein [Pedobacter cryoconitis]